MHVRTRPWIDWGHIQGVFPPQYCQDRESRIEVLVKMKPKWYRSIFDHVIMHDRS